MKEKKYLGKFDKWLTEKGREDSWSSVVVEFIGLLIFYPLMYFGPEIAFYIEGVATPPLRHKFTMMWFNALCIIILFFTLLKIIRLLRVQFNSRNQ